MTDMTSAGVRRLARFLIGAYCACAILFAAWVVPALSVATWGGGPRQAIGPEQILIGLSILAAGFGFPKLVYALGHPLGWIILGLGWAACVAARLVWPGDDMAALTVILGLAALHGMGLFWALGNRMGGS